MYSLVCINIPLALTNNKQYFVIQIFTKQQVIKKTILDTLF